MPEVVNNEHTSPRKEYQTASMVYSGPKTAEKDLHPKTKTRPTSRNQPGGSFPSVFSLPQPQNKPTHLITFHPGPECAKSRALRSTPTQHPCEQYAQQQPVRPRHDRIYPRARRRYLCILGVRRPTDPVQHVRGIVVRARKTGKVCPIRTVERRAIRCHQFRRALITRARREFRSEGLAEWQLVEPVTRRVEVRDSFDVAVRIRRRVDLAADVPHQVVRVQGYSLPNA